MKKRMISQEQPAHSRLFKNKTEEEEGTYPEYIRRTVTVRFNPSQPCTPGGPNPPGIRFWLLRFQNACTSETGKVNLHSTVTNSRNLEDRTYLLWQIICNALISDCPQFLVAP
jgi:hypothetical protein